MIAIMFAIIGNTQMESFLQQLNFFNYEIKKVLLISQESGNGKS